MELDDQQSAALAALKAAGHSTTDGLSRALALPGSTVGTILRQLESLGYASHTVDEGLGEKIWAVTVEGADALDKLG